jgi:hypothetical protein
MYYLEIDFWDNVIDGVYSENHKFLTIVYLSYCNILSSSQMYYLQNHMVHTSYFQIYLFIYKNRIITLLHWFFELTNYHKVTYIIWTYYEFLSNHTHARYISCEQQKMPIMPIIDFCDGVNDHGSSKVHDQ